MFRSRDEAFAKREQHLMLDNNINLRKLYLAFMIVIKLDTFSAKHCHKNLIFLKIFD